MKFKGQGKINICGFEYKKNIADSRRGGGGFRAQKNPCIRACLPECHYGSSVHYWFLRQRDFSGVSQTTLGHMDRPLVD